MKINRLQLIDDLWKSWHELDDSAKNLKKLPNSKELYEKRKKIKKAKELLFDYIQHLKDLTDEEVEIEDNA